MDCVQTGPITLGTGVSTAAQGETVFSERQSLILKALKVTRILDRGNNVLIYLAHARN